MDTQKIVFINKALNTRLAGLLYIPDNFNLSNNYPAVVVTGPMLSVKEQEYVIAAKTFGAGGGRIIRRHLLPNAIGVIIVSTALQIPSAIFTESYLSFLGLGVNAPMPSLGSLASDALNGIESYPSRLIFPAAVISLTVLALNLIGDGLRDSFDPSISGSR